VNKKETIIRASHSVDFACGHLQDLLKTSSAVESIIVLKMIEHAARLEYVDGLPDDGLIDVCKAKDINTVIHTMRPLDFFLWAHDGGYTVEIDDCCEIALKTHEGKPEYFGWLQHKDSFHEFDRSGVGEIARWM